MGKPKSLVKYGVLILILALGFFVYMRDKTIVKESGYETVNDREKLVYFEQKHPDTRIILAVEGDLNDDKIDDLIVVFKREKEDGNRMLAVVNRGEDFIFSDEVPAPLEDVEITFKNIDDEGVMEFIVSGAKNGNYGYAIFRLTDDLRIRDLFSENMEDCC